MLKEVQKIILSKLLEMLEIENLEWIALVLCGILLYVSLIRYAALFL